MFFLRDPLKFRLIYWLAVVVGLSGVRAVTINGFPVGGAAVPIEHLKRAAPARDSIPALDDPRFVAPGAPTALADSDHVFSLTIGTETKAYPLRVLVWHEVVNDEVGGVPVVVTYSALTGTALAFNAGKSAPEAPGGFGVSGVLYNSGLLFYDRATSSLWSQLKGAAIAGPRHGEALAPLAGFRQTWSSWKQANPNGKVLWPDNDRHADYAGDWPYGDYAEQEATLFPFDINRRDFTTKVRLLALVIDGKARAWPEEKLGARTSIYDSLGSRQLKVAFDASAQKGEVRDLSTGELLPAISVYWFAWQAFHPDTSVWLPME